MERRGEDRKGAEWRGEEEKRRERRGGNVYINISFENWVFVTVCN